MRWARKSCCPHLPQRRADHGTGETGGYRYGSGANPLGRLAWATVSFLTSPSL